MKIRLVSYLSMSVLLLSAVAGAQAQDPLPSWNDGAAKRAILNFVRETTDPSSPSFVPPEQRIANFDQGGTTWAVYQPMRELERYLRANEYKTVTEGEQEPVRIYAEQLYGVPPDQGIGTERFASGVFLAMLVLPDDAQREYVCELPCGQLGSPSETLAQAFYDQAHSKGWTVISMQNDWNRRFASEESGPWDPHPPELWFVQEPAVASSGHILPAGIPSTPAL